MKKISVLVFIILTIILLINIFSDNNTNQITENEAIVSMQNLISENFTNSDNVMYKQSKQDCDNGKMNGCLAVASMYNLGEGSLKKDEDIALALFKKACDAGIPKGCILSGSVYLYGKESIRNYKEAFTVFNRECNNKNMIGCVVLGSMYEQGNGREIDLNKAKDLYGKACKNNEETGCLGFNQVIKSLYKNKPIIILGNKMWQDEQYTNEERQEYSNFGKKPVTGIGKALNWEQAKLYCQNLTLEGFSDWYLPSKKDLMQLYQNQMMLKNTLIDHFWSSSLLYPNIEKSTVWDVYMKDGKNYKANPNTIDFVRCVRNIK